MNAPLGGAGGNGGGGIHLQASAVSIAGNVSANGQDGQGDGTTIAPQACTAGHNSVESCWDWS